MKGNSTGGLLIISAKNSHQTKMKIKLEIDTDPLQGSAYELKYLDFPLPYSINVQDLPSLFAGKCHALLCRPYTKGRDWYDFSWYITRNTPLNFQLLSHAFKQAGPWKNHTLAIDKEWLIKQLSVKISALDWEEAKQDVVRFLKPRDAEALAL